jgi:hypothetical protein
MPSGMGRLKFGGPREEPGQEEDQGTSIGNVDPSRKWKLCLK